MKLAEKKTYDQKIDDSENNLRDLMIQSQAGDKSAYQELLESLDSLALRYCKRALPSESMAQDCRQDILLSIHKMLHTYDSGRSFFAWFYTISRNKVIDYYRKSGRLKSKEIVDTETVMLGSVRGEQEESDHKMTVKNLLNELSEEFKQPLILSKLYGYSTRDISKRLNISETLVKVRVYRGLRKLREAMNKDMHQAVTDKGS